MSPQIKMMALKSVLADMAAHAKKMKGDALMGPMASAEMDEAPVEEMAISPMGADAEMAGDAASQGALDEEDDEPTDDEMAEMMRGQK